MPYKPLVALSLSALLCCSLQAAEQAPIGIAAVTLDQATYDFDTAEQHGIRVRVLARELPRSFAMAFLPDGDLLISERGGNLRLLRDATGSNPILEDEPVAGVPALDPPYRNGGLHDLALHPDFASNGWLYFTYNKGEDVAEGQQRRSAVTLMRGRYADGQLSEVEELFSGDYGSTSGSRIVFAQDGTLYMTTGAPFGNEAQELDNVYGKVLRLNDDGSIPADNPFVGRADAHPAIFSLGHRDQLGLTEHPATGAILSVEHGPNGGDEVNLIQPGHNFGWPTVSFGRNYDGSPVADGMVAE
ncbi:MAG TPA: PQQ-dependent sugar dehydrogenase, partial [Pseudomonadaceae bacterium]|nr:PQQ-dependent sugar dehydrogenase [Pseudomonadaceae bacterium]